MKYLLQPGCPAATCRPSIPATCIVKPTVAYRRERWDTPDGDFIDVDLRRRRSPGAPLLVLFHGLEGSSGEPLCARR